MQKSYFCRCLAKHVSLKLQSHVCRTLVFNCLHRQLNICHPSTWLASLPLAGAVDCLQCHCMEQSILNGAVRLPCTHGLWLCRLHKAVDHVLLNMLSSSRSTHLLMHHLTGPSHMLHWGGHCGREPAGRVLSALAGVPLRRLQLGGWSPITFLGFAPALGAT